MRTKSSKCVQTIPTEPKPRTPLPAGKPEWFAPKLSILDDDQKAQLCEWLIKHTYAEVRELVRTQFNMTVCMQSLKNYYNKHVAVHVIAKRAEGLGLLQKINFDIKKHPAEYDRSVIDALMMRIQHIALDDGASTKQLKMLTDAVSRLRTLAMDEKNLNFKLRQLAMLERKEQRANEALRDTKLNSDEVATRLREIFQK
jgi:hypothetical protein